MGRSAMYPLTRNNNQKTTVQSFGGDVEVRWVCQLPVQDFQLVYTAIDGYSVSVLRDFWVSQNGASTSTFSFTLNGVTYNNLLFVNDTFTQTMDSKPNRYTVSMVFRQTRT
jgi:hypothetical protein